MIELKQMPNETPARFAAFCAFARSGPGRSLPKLATDLQIPVRKLSAWAGRHKWRLRAEDYDLRVVEAEGRLHDEMLSRRAVDWVGRREQLREQEYALAMQLFSRARQYLDNPRMVARPCDIVAMLEIASELSRRACGPIPPPANPAAELASIKFHESLKRVYGSVVDPAPGSSLDAPTNAVAPPAGAQLPNTVPASNPSQNTDFQPKTQFQGGPARPWPPHPPV